MNKSIKINNQTIIKILEIISHDKSRYPELWEIISGQKINGKESPNNSGQKTDLKFIGNLDFLNLKKIESPKLLAELTERINRGEINLNVFDCCYLLRCFSFIRQNVETANSEKSPADKQATLPISVKELDWLVMMVLHWLKKDNLLCPQHSKLIEAGEKKEVEEDKKVTN